MEALERIKKGKWKEKNGNGGVESSKLHKRSASIINTESTLFSTDGSRITAVNSRQVRNCKKKYSSNDILPCKVEKTTYLLGKI